MVQFIDTSWPCNSREKEWLLNHLTKTLNCALSRHTNHNAGERFHIADETCKKSISSVTMRFKLTAQVWHALLQKIAANSVCNRKHFISCIKLFKQGMATNARGQTHLLHRCLIHKTLHQLHIFGRPGGCAKQKRALMTCPHCWQPVQNSQAIPLKWWIWVWGLLYDDIAKWPTSYNGQHDQQLNNACFCRRNQGYDASKKARWRPRSRQHQISKSNDAV